MVDLRGSTDSALDVAGVTDAAGGPRLTVVLAAASTPAPAGAEVIEIGSLQPDEVRAILATYVDEAIADDSLDEVFRTSGGMPNRVHNEGLAVARRRAAAAVSGAAARAGQVGTDLDAARADLRQGVTRYRELIELQAVVDSRTCPWKGLVAYDVADAPWFAGRGTAGGRAADAPGVGPPGRARRRLPGPASHRFSMRVYSRHCRQARCPAASAGCRWSCGPARTRCARWCGPRSAVPTRQRTARRSC